MEIKETSIFVTTYNWPEALSLCIKSILAQTVLPTEIIVADDGSTDETRKVVEMYQDISEIPINHIWIEDKGYRINLIRNLAIKAAKYPFIFQIDGDIILDKNFIKDHLKCAKVNQINIGRRVRLNKEKTDEILKTKDISSLSYLRSYVVCLLGHYLQYSSKSVRGLRGCNTAYWKSDALKVNGYNEGMKGKGRNDKEFGARLIQLGVKGFNIKYYAICYHLDHEDTSRSFDLQYNIDIFESTLKSKQIRTSNGIEKL